MKNTDFESSENFIFICWQTNYILFYLSVYFVRLAYEKLLCVCVLYTLVLEETGLQYAQYFAFVAVL